jgi:multidrug efflux pump
MGPFEAAMHAAKLRLRPIVMTSLAFILGCIPLAIAHGASAASRRSLGTGVVFGMLGCSTIALLFIPMFYWGLETLANRKKKAAAQDAPAAGAHPPAIGQEH